ncbi:unnamed protein product, partial [marine sediment metagenome]
FGMVERKGTVVAVTVPNVKKATLMPHVVERVIPASTIYTDELKSYNGLSRQGFKHDKVQHSEKVYVSGDVHVNTMRAFGRWLREASVVCIMQSRLSIFRAT